MADRLNNDLDDLLSGETALLVLSQGVGKEGGDCCQTPQVEPYQVNMLAAQARDRRPAFAGIRGDAVGMERVFLHPHEVHPIDAIRACRQCQHHCADAIVRWHLATQQVEQPGRQAMRPSAIGDRAGQPVTGYLTPISDHFRQRHFGRVGVPVLHRLCFEHRPNPRRHRPKRRLGVRRYRSSDPNRKHPAAQAAREGGITLEGQLDAAETFSKRHLGGLVAAGLQRRFHGLLGSGLPGVAAFNCGVFPRVRGAGLRGRASSRSGATGRGIRSLVASRA